MEPTPDPEDEERSHIQNILTEKLELQINSKKVDELVGIRKMSSQMDDGISKKKTVKIDEEKALSTASYIEERKPKDIKTISAFYN